MLLKQNVDSLEKTLMLGGIGGRRRRGWQRMAGWHHRLDGHVFEWTPGVGDGQGGLVCCNSWGCKESDTTERLNWTENKMCQHLEDPHRSVSQYFSKWLTHEVTKPGKHQGSIQNERGLPWVEWWPPKGSWDRSSGPSTWTLNPRTRVLKRDERDNTETSGGEGPVKTEVDSHWI